MEIFALYGPSGTGKSTSALALAHKYHIEAIIDDGLLIYKGRKVAGYSAKYEKTTIQAVKRAIFFYEDHAEEMKKALETYPLQRLLILGTSKKMVNRIADALNLKPISHYIDITEVRSTSEIKAALYDRQTQGRHVIPIPRIQVEQDFVHRLIDRVEKIFSPKKEIIGETTIVQPHYQYGKINIHEDALRKLILHSCHSIHHIQQFHKIQVTLSDRPRAELHLSLKTGMKENIREIARSIQQQVYFGFSNHLNIELEQIDLRISHIFLKP